MEPLVQLFAEDCTRTTGDLGRRLSGQNGYSCIGTSPPLSVQLDYPMDNPALSTLVVYQRLSGEQSQHFSGPGQLLITLPAKASTTEVILQYVNAGIVHILIGYDHLLFVLCLMFMAGSTQRLLLTITGFTLAHSLTLALSSFSILQLPIEFVEVLIALSIVILAAEIIKNNRSSLAWRYPMVTASTFGLLHGFGFASVLGELGLPNDLKLTALVFFNIGVELGQIAFIAGCLLLIKFALALSKRLEWPITALANWGIYLVGIISSYWLTERLVAIVS
jgi:hydrogenase/urease accessory protein HupE